MRNLHKPRMPQHTGSQTYSLEIPSVGHQAVQGLCKEATRQPPTYKILPIRLVRPLGDTNPSVKCHCLGFLLSLLLCVLCLICFMCSDSGLHHTVALVG